MPERLIRTSERSCFKKCRQSWDWEYNQQLKPKLEAPALRFGTMIHKALELRYPPGRKRGPLPAETFERLYGEAIAAGAEKYSVKTLEETWEEAGALGVAMMENFIVEYGADEEYEVIASEQRFRVPVLHPTTGRVLFIYVGTLDGIWRDLRTKRVLFQDWKTTAAIDTSHLALDEQAGAYWTYAPEWLIAQGILKPNQTISHILFTFLRKQAPDQRPRDEKGHYLNQDGTVSKKQPAPYFARKVVWRDAADREAVRTRVLNEWREMQMVARGKLAVYKNPGQSCQRCGFRDLCELHETAGDWEEFRDQTTTTWEPYSDHELESEGKG